MSSRLTLLAFIALLAVPVGASSEPSKAFTKCQKMLTRNAESHIEKSNRLQDRYEARLADLVQSKLAGNTGGKSTDEELRAAVERFKNYRRIDQARAAYVEDIVEQVAQSMAHDVPNFTCHDRSAVRTAYDLNYQAYETVLQLLENDVEERFDLERLDDDEGLLIIAFNSTEATNFVRINRLNALGGTIVFGPNRRGEQFRVIRAKAGTYEWEEIEQKFYNSRRTYNLRKFDMQFDVVAGKLNYAGVFLLDVESNGYYRASLNDRLIITLTALEQRYPELIDQYEIANGLHPDDRFTDFYLSEKRLAIVGVANETID